MSDRNEMILHGGQQHALAPQYAQPRQFIPPPEPQEASLLQSLLRHYVLVFVAVSLAIGLAFGYLQYATKQYTSTAKFTIDNAIMSSAGPGAQDRGGTLFTQCEIIRSVPLLDDLVAELNSKPATKNLKSFADVTPVLFLRENVQAEVGRRDDIISVSLTTPYKDEIPLIVNKLVEVYKTKQFDARIGPTQALLESLLRQQQALQVQVNEKDQKLDEMMRSDIQLATKGDSSPAITRWNEATRQLAAQELMKMQLEQRLGSNHPDVRRAREMEERLRDAYDDAQKSVARFLQKSADRDKIIAEKMELKTDVDALRPRVSAAQLDLDQAQKIGNMRMIEPAAAALYPSSPRKSQTLALGGVLGLVLGCCLALLRERMDSRLRSVEDIQMMIGLPILGVVPRMPGRRTAVARAMAVHLDPRSEVAEAYRTVRTAVYFGAHGQRTKTLLVTSPEPGDGKTTSASNLAIAIAQTGRSILLLDADFRKPTQHKNLDVKDAIGLSSVLAGAVALDRAIQRTGVEGLDILPCGPIPENPSEILNSQEFGELVDKLSMRYDHVLFDSPPVNAVTDARILGAVCDVTILVLRQDKSTRKAAEHARNALMSVGANVVGCIVNGVPRGRGYEVYGGSYYGQPEMRRPKATAPTVVAETADEATVRRSKTGTDDA